MLRRRLQLSVTGVASSHSIIAPHLHPRDVTYQVPKYTPVPATFLCQPTRTNLRWSSQPPPTAHTSTLDTAQDHLGRLWKAVHVAELDVLQLKHIIKCLEESIGKNRSLSDDEYIALGKGAAAGIRLAFVQATTTLDTFSKEKAELELEKANLELEKVEQELEKAEQEANEEVKEAEQKEIVDEKSISDFIASHTQQRQFLILLKTTLTEALGERTFTDWVDSKGGVEKIVRDVVTKTAHTFENGGPPVADAAHLTTQLLADIEATACLLARERDPLRSFVSWRWIDGKTSRLVSRQLKGDNKKKHLQTLNSRKGGSEELATLAGYLSDLQRKINSLKKTRISTVFLTLGGFSRQQLTNVFSRSRGFGNIISKTTLNIDALNGSSDHVGDRWKLAASSDPAATKEARPFYFITSMPRQGKSLLLDSVDVSVGSNLCNVYPITYNGGSPVQASDRQCSTMASQFWNRVICSIVFCIVKYCNSHPHVDLKFRPTSAAAQKIHSRIWGGPAALAVDEFSEVVCNLNGNDTEKKMCFSEITCAYSWCSLMVFSGFSTAADTAFSTASGRVSVCITIKPVTERADFLRLVPLVSSVCSVLHADDMIYFEAIKSSPGLLGYYLEAKDRGGFLAKTASQVPWGRAICASRPVSLYLESLHHILLHKNLPESVLVRGIMPLRRDLDRNTNALGLIRSNGLAARLEASYLAIQVERSDIRFVQPHVFPCYILMKHFCDELGQFMGAFWSAINCRVPLLNAALGQSFPASLKDKQLDTIAQFGLELRSELLVKAIVCAAQMRLEAGGKEVSRVTSCPLFPVLVSIEAPGWAEKDWGAISDELKKYPNEYKELNHMAEIAQSRLEQRVLTVTTEERVKAILEQLEGGMRVIEPSDSTNAGSDLSVFTVQADGKYHVDVVEAKYGSGGTSKLGDLNMKHLITLLGILHFVSELNLLEDGKKFRISSVRFHVAALVAEKRGSARGANHVNPNAKMVSNKAVNALQSALRDKFGLKVENVDEVKNQLLKLGITVGEPAVYDSIRELEQLVLPPLLHMLPNVALCGQFSKP